MSTTTFCDKCGCDVGSRDPQPNVKIDYVHYYFCDPCLKVIQEQFDVMRREAYRLCGLRWSK